MNEEIEKPICPYCKTKMIPVSYVGYYDSFDYWECKCDNLKTEEKWKGAYA